MKITKQMLVDRKAAYQQDFLTIQKQVQSSMSALKGAMDDCDFWISELEKAEKVEEGIEEPG